MGDVYIAGSLRHTTKEWWKIYEKIGKVVEEFGLKSHIPHIDTAEKLVQNVEAALKNPFLDDSIVLEVYKKNIEVINNAKLIIAEVTNPSTGTGFEIATALNLKKPIICLARKDANVTSMVRGPTTLGLINLIRYEDEEDALKQLRNLLATRFKSLTEKQTLCRN